jgi:signal transduction histidine kinase
MSQRAKEFGGELRLMRIDPGTLVEVAIPSVTSENQKTHAMV